jgi:hypothetical protein
MEIEEQSTQLLLPSFGEGFLRDHAGLIMTDPKIAVVELVANSWDAGADQVTITWPEKYPGFMAIEDNGTGMTFNEFTRRWPELSYNRIEDQGDDVDFPSDNRKSSRKAFGRNGKGRHSMFCFADEYLVETWRDGEANQFKITYASGRMPFRITHEDRFPKNGHGTVISTTLTYTYLSIPNLRDLIGSKFVVDPSFEIYVNEEIVQLTDLEHLCETEMITINEWGSVLLRRYDTQEKGRTSKQNGVAWWVNKRLVGEPSWKRLEGAYLDARTSEAKRYTFVVEADILADQVKDDWSWFHASEKTEAVVSKVEGYVLRKLNELMQDVRKSRKIAVLEEHKKVLGNLPPISQYHLGRFLEEIQIQCPTLGQKELSDTVNVLSNLERSRSGYALLEQLAKLDAEDIDELNLLLDRWSVRDVQIVMSELDWRLRLVERLEDILESESSDELHDIQPLFERGLWIFGPEYEAINFMSNRSLSTIVRRFFHDQGAILPNPRKRPDFVALPDSSIGIYSSDDYDERGEVNGIKKVLIVELKRGGSRISRKERQQALDYANEIRSSGKILDQTTIVGFVLGTTVENDALSEISEGRNTTIYPRPYSTVLRQAKSRTFDLLKKLKTAHKEALFDQEVEQVLAAPEQLSLLERAN